MPFFPEITSGNYNRGFSVLITAFFIALMLCLFIQPPSAFSQDQPTSKPELFGAVRPVFTTQHFRDRSGGNGSVSAMNVRIHAGASWQFHQDWLFRGRIAGRYASNQSEFRFFIRDHTGGGGSYSAGVTTLDEFFLRWKPSERITLHAGRFQGRFPLAGFIPKGMDRYYSANLSIGHTDGIWMTSDLSSRYRLHFIASHNGTRGSTHAARSPLEFSQSLSRISLFANLEHRNTSGRWVQREISVSVIPQSFERDGSYHAYTTFSGRVMMRLPFTPQNGEFQLGGEVAFVPLAPENAGGISETRTLIEKGAVAWQVSAYANDVISGHRLGLLYGQTEPQWLVSSSFSPNRRMAEIRYRYTINSRLNYEMRYRIQTDLFKPPAASNSLRINDFYARFTYRF